MEIVTRIARMRHLAPRLKQDRKKLALVPTMSALHEGHLSLIRRAQILADAVVVSIFFSIRFTFRPERSLMFRPVTWRVMPS